PSTPKQSKCVAWETQSTSGSWTQPGVPNAMPKPTKPAHNFGETRAFQFVSRTWERILGLMYLGNTSTLLLLLIVGIPSFMSLLDLAISSLKFRITHGMRSLL